jgi:hypothetical protein
MYEQAGRREDAMKHMEKAIQYSPPSERPPLERILEQMKTHPSRMNPKTS